MARARKRHVQLGLMNAAGTRIWKNPGERARVLARRSTAERRKPGRPKKPDAGVPHASRKAFTATSPLHVVIRVIEDIRNLRRAALYHAIREATLVAARNAEQFRIVHISIQRTHIHMLVEADHKAALARGMQGFQISAAKQINAAISKRRDERRRGRVFSDRYHVEIISSRRRARHALAYVLNNWRKHREDDGRTWLVDPFSTGALFSGWKQLEGRLLMWHTPETYLPMFVWFPRTWLLTEGWRMYGLIDGHEVPSSRTNPRAAAR